MFKGYLEFGDGGEVLNIDRTEAYIRNSAANLPFHPQGSKGTLALANGDKPYRSPLLDAAPWANPLDPVTNDFYGLYPLDILGIGDSTFAASTTESVEDGGSTQRGRNSTRDVKVSGLLMAKTELAAETGLTWLRSMLQDVECSDACGGGSLRYYLADPDICEVAWGKELETKQTVTFGDVAPGKVYDVRWTKNVVDPTMPSHTVWTGVASYGAEIRFGARALDGTVLAEDDVFTVRENYVPNPTFLSGLNTWTGTGTSWVYAGGTDGGAYAHLQASAPVTSQNYGVGLYGRGNFGSVANGTLVSPRLPAPASQVLTASVALRGDGTRVLLQIVDGTTNSVVSTATVYPDGTWQRYSVAGVTTGGAVLRIAAVGQVDVDQAMVEAGGDATDYFDGSMVDPLYQTAWSETPNGSSSVRRFIGAWETIWDTSDYLPFFEVVSGTVSNLRLTWFYRDAFDVSRQLLAYERSLHNVAVTQGPTIIQRIDNTGSTGGYFIQVEMLFTAGNPFSYAPSRDIPVADAVQSATITDPLPNIAPSDDWLYDPNALIPSSPPGAPDIVADAIDSSITTWQRYYFPIPAEDVADWASSVPLMDIDVAGVAVRQVRVRFHPNPFGYAVDKIDPLSYCADFLISYLPAYTSLSLNGMVQTASATKAGKANVPADSVLYGSDGGPMTWPRLSCAIPYVMTVDVPSPADYDLFELTLGLAREE